MASSLANFNINDLSTRLFCHLHMLPKRRHGFGVWSIFAFIIKCILDIKCIFPCSFGNKHMRLLTWPCIRYIILDMAHSGHSVAKYKSNHYCAFYQLPTLPFTTCTLVGTKQHCWSIKLKPSGSVTNKG